MLEKYARGYAVAGGMEVHAAVAVLPDEDFDEVAIDIRNLSEATLTRFGANHTGLAEEMSRLIRKRWPDRAFFVETDEDKRGLQYWQPFERPPNGCCPHCRGTDPTERDE